MSETILTTKMKPRRSLKLVRVGRCLLFLGALALLLPFTILLMVADQQYNVTYNSKRVFYQESDFYKINGTFYTSVMTVTPLKMRKLRNAALLIENPSFSRNSKARKILYPQTDDSYNYLYENNVSHGDAFLSKEKFMEVNARMEARRAHLKYVCSKLGLDDSSHKAYTWEFMINKQYHVIWCNVFKAASTSWMYNFNRMANYTAAYLNKTKEVPLQLARKKYARPTAEMVKKAQQDSLTFIIVRHPMERLASAYNDKIVHAWPKTFHEKMGHKIIKKYRNWRYPDKKGPKYPLFEEFVQYVLDESKAKGNLDMHWTPYTGFCSPCKINFDIIIKFETLNEDQKYLIQMANLQDVVKAEWRNAGKGRKANNVSALFSRLSKKQLDGLNNLYNHDLQLFNYTMDGYYKLVKDDIKQPEKSNDALVIQ